ncbi:hypothetical protein RND81_11G013800 [Saponaria officinalis]|uniref:Poor homologous synapsis 1 PH domain-containing protein n=1 Tax=Saponaria officinalis TaxID=3572 RepID=A0AAW1HH46_SAPOF
MAGELTVAVTERETVVTKWQWRWRAQYARCFTFPHSSSSSSTTINDHTDNHLSISKNLFKPSWLSSVESSTVSLLPSDHSLELSVLTVSLSDTILEEHYVSKLHFAWPQVSCLSGFPTRSSLIIIASYTDCRNEKQKFALRFSTPSEIENFITSLEDVYSNKFPKEPSPVDVISPISSQSEFIPPYRPDTSNIMNPIYASPRLKNFHDENQQDSQSQIRDTVGDYERNGVWFPPSFTSLVSSCSAEPVQNALALILAPEVQDCGLKAEITIS